MYILLMTLLLTASTVTGCSYFEGKKVIADPLVQVGAAMAAQNAVYYALRDKPGTDFDKAVAVVNEVGDAIKEDGTYDMMAARDAVSQHVPQEWQLLAFNIVTALEVELTRLQEEGKAEDTRRLVNNVILGAKNGVMMAKEYQDRDTKE